jgi:hypothetical protein
MLGLHPAVRPPLQLDRTAEFLAGRIVAALPPLRLSQFSVFGIRRGLMAAFVKGFIDDSKRGPIWAIGGYITEADTWDVFERQWSEALARHGVPYFHMRELNASKGPYAKWCPHGEHREEIAAFMADLAKVVRQNDLTAICSLVRQVDLERFNAEHRTSLEPYPLAPYGCMVLAARQNPKSKHIELVFDNVEKVHSKLGTALSYAEADTVYDPGLCHVIQTIPLSKGTTWRDLAALQAADFLAWEYRRNHENVGAWFDLINRPEDWDARWSHFEEWLTLNVGTSIPAIRKSAAALINGTPFYGLIWDYKNLCDAHRARGGAW